MSRAEWRRKMQEVDSWSGRRGGGIVEKRRDDTVCAALASVNVTVLVSCASRMQAVLQSALSALSAGPTLLASHQLFASLAFAVLCSALRGPRVQNGGDDESGGRLRSALRAPSDG